MENISILYRKFCEVIVINDFYLIDSGSKSFYSLTSQEQSLLLNKKIQSGNYDIRKDFKFLVNRSNLEKFKNYHIKPLFTDKGFYLGIEVISTIENGEIKYKPFVNTPEDLTIQIGIEIINPQFFNFTNIKFPNEFQKCYYFTNEGFHDGNSLSVPIDELGNSEEFFQMGELARTGNTIIQAIEDNYGDSLYWEKIEGTGFVNKKDLKIGFDQDYYIEYKSEFPSPSPIIFGIIEIQFNTADSDFSLITETGELNIKQKQGNGNYSYPQFEIRLLSKITYWRFRKRGGFDDKEKAFIDAASIGVLDQINADYVSKKPLMFSKGKTNLNDSLSKFPNANHTSLKKEGKKIYSDIYFNSIQPVPK